MPYYNLISCNTSLYPTLGPFYRKSTHPLEGQIVYQIADPTKLYTLTLVTGEFLAVSNLPRIDLSVYTSCSQAEHYYTLKSCVTGQLVRYLFPFAQTVGDVLRFANNCDAWEILAYDGGTVTSLAPTVEASYSGATACLDALQDLDMANCEVSEVTLGYAVRAIIPVQQTIDRGFEECCFENVVLADASSTDNEKNDYTSFYYKAQAANDSVTFTLIRLSDNSEYNLTGGTYGDLATDSGLTTFKLKWKQVLAALGVGLYRVRKNISIAGQAIEILSNTYSLQRWNSTTADNTVRFDASLTGKMEHLGFAFDKYETTVRVPGYFGNGEPQYTKDYNVQSDYFSKQVSIRKENEYIFQSGMLPSCIAEELTEFIFLADSLKVTDYNANNSNYNIVELPIELGDNSGSSYPVFTRKVQLNFSFVDAYKNHIKRTCK